MNQVPASTSILWQIQGKMTIILLMVAENYHLLKGATMTRMSERIFELVTSISVKMTETETTLATAESCTSGLVSFYLTQLAGSSAFFKGGVAVYSNHAKSTLLGIPEDQIASRGAVSEEVACAMADRARVLLETDYGISLTGIAGPDGGTAEKPVGTVWFGLSTKNATGAELLKLDGSRSDIREMAAQIALERLFQVL